jgi:hypothetical protein
MMTTATAFDHDDVAVRLPRDGGRDRCQRQGINGQHRQSCKRTRGSADDYQMFHCGVSLVRRRARTFCGPQSSFERIMQSSHKALTGRIRAKHPRVAGEPFSPFLDGRGPLRAQRFGRRRLCAARSGNNEWNAVSFTKLEDRHQCDCGRSHDEKCGRYLVARTFHQPGCRKG